MFLNSGFQSGVLIRSFKEAGDHSETIDSPIHRLIGGGHASEAQNDFVTCLTDKFPQD